MQKNNRFDNIIESLGTFARFTKEELDLLFERIQPLKIGINEILLSPGEICESVYFVESGSLRQFFVDSDMEEITTGLFIENDWVVNNKSFILRQPSDTTIVATDACNLFELDIQALHELIGKSQAFFQLGKLLEIPLIGSERTGGKLRPEEKYREILQNKPLLLQKFPLKHIASYLQITPETLSRIRKKVRNTAS